MATIYKSITMTPEQKAKRYDEVIAKAQKELQTCGSTDCDAARQIYRFFPELKESEGERIRKWLIDTIKSVPNDSIEWDVIDKSDVLAWLEKQNEHKDYYTKQELIDMGFSFTLNGDIVTPDKMMEDMKKYLAWKEKQGKQKQTPPKWKYKKDNTPLLRDSIILNKYGGVAKSPSGAVVSDVWILDYDELAKLPKEEIEKQGEQKQDPCEHCKDKCLNCHNFPCVDKREFEQGKSAMEAINEENVDNQNCVKTTNKVEPKFNIGDWLCENEPNNYARFIQILKTSNAQGKERYRISRDIHNDEDVVELDFIEKYYHKFDIEDAKNGDVLVNGSNIFIFSHFSDIARVMGYCHINLDDGRFYDDKDKNECFGLIDAVFSPTTEEQRNLLFAKMHEAGFEWNAEKKELKRLEKQVEQKLKWSENDEHHWMMCVACVEECATQEREDFSKTIDWLKSLKQRMEQ